MLTVSVIRHIHFEDLGSLEAILLSRGYEVRYHDVHEPIIFSAPPSLLIVLGGPIGAFDEDAYPFLRDELDLINSQLAAGKPILGICLGAQLLARALGANVRPMDRKEIGFGPVELTSDGAHSEFAALAGIPVLHWHGDKFDVPEGARLLAKTRACPQAFTFGEHVLAIQFHLELVPERIEQWLVGHASELGALGISPQDIRAQARAYGDELRASAELVLTKWLDRVMSS